MNRAVPLIIVLTPNTLSSMGLRDLLTTILPFAVVKVCGSNSELREIEPEDIFHVFVSSQLLLEDMALFTALKNKTIALTNGSNNAMALREFHQVNIQQSEEQIVASIKALHNHAHGEKPQVPSQKESGELLSPREIEVTKLLVEGLINKEIATRLDIGVTTVITHRKNIFEKLGIRSIAGLTIYAIMKRYIEI